jgi:hypothetical protein
MSDDFEDHCWKDIVTPDDLEIYSHYRRKTFVGPAPAPLAIDLHALVCRGGAKPPLELVKTLGDLPGGLDIDKLILPGVTRVTD